MITENEKSPLTRNASGQENGTEIEARGLSAAVNGTQTENLTSRKSPAPGQASEATAARPSMEDSTAEGIVDARTACGNETSSKVSRSDALTADEREVLEHTAGFLHATAATALRKLLSASPALQPAAAPIDDEVEAAARQYEGIPLDVARGLARAAIAAAAPADALAATPAAKWRIDGEPDPHADRYDVERAALTLGMLTDDELANGAFMNYDRPMDIARSLSRDPDYHSPIVWMTAVKDRIRWLSRALEKARASSANETGAEGVRAWQTDDGRVISDAQKQQALRDGGASASSVRPFHIALGKISAAQAAEPVGEIVTFGPELKEVSWRAGKMPEIGTKLYAVPQPPAQVSGIIEAIAAQWDGCTYASPGEDIDIGTAIRTAWKRLSGSSTQADARIDVEAMLRACVPGGNICDPQRIADSIREWFNERGAREGAREGLTDSERNAIERAISEVELCCQFSLASELRALLAAHPDQPTARADDWIRVDVQRPIDAGIAPDDDVLAWNNDPGFPTIVEASFVTLSFPEYTHWKAKPKGPADTAQTGDAS